MGLSSNECHINKQVIRRLQDVDWVLGDQTELVDVAFSLRCVAAVPSLASTERQVFERAFLNNVFGFQVGFEVVTVVAVTVSAVRAICGHTIAVDAFTVSVTGHEAQAWYAVLSHFQVITQLNRTFFRAVEVGVLDRVGQENRVAAAVVVTYTD